MVEPGFELCSFWLHSHPSEAPPSDDSLQGAILAGCKNLKELSVEEADRVWFQARPVSTKRWGRAYGSKSENPIPSTVLPLSICVSLGKPHILGSLVPKESSKKAERWPHYSGCRQVPEVGSCGKSDTSPTPFHKPQSSLKAAPMSNYTFFSQHEGRILTTKFFSK